MCGFFGHIKDEADSSMKESFYELKSRKLIKQRGPDEENDYSLANAFFYHSRLSLMSPTVIARQPYPCFEKEREGEAILLFNGSIYNYKLLNPNAHSDTQVLYDLATKDSFNIKHLNGAFCFSLYHPHKRHLQVFRDRLGIRPLFYAMLDKAGKLTSESAAEVIYSTNLTPIVEFLKRRGIVISEDESAKKQYMSFRFVRNPEQTFFKGIHQLAPGHELSWSVGDKVLLRPYWQLEDFHDQPRITSGQFTEEAKSLLESAIELRGVSATPICSFLSGGLDSGLITAVGLKKSFIKKSFHLAVPGRTNEEGRLQSFLQQYPHSNQVISFRAPSEASIGRIFRNLEQPVGDSVVFLLDQLYEGASQDFKIGLSGDGADELFGGYVHHRLFQVVQLFHRIFPDVIRGPLINLASKLPLSFFNTFFPYSDRVDAQGVEKLVSFLRRFHKPFQAYSYLVSLADLNEEDACMDGVGSYWQEMTAKSFSIEQLITFDLKYWGPGYSLYKIDRLSFGQGLEVRAPFYDHRLIELCLGQDFVGLKNIGSPKVALQKSAQGLLNRQVISQKKFPFRVQDHYLKEADTKDVGLLKNKKEVCLNNYQHWRDGLEDQGSL